MSFARAKARKLAMQALYQWQIGGENIREIDEQFLENNSLRKVDIAYFQHLLHEIPKLSGELNDVMAPMLSRSVDEVDPTEHAILWIGTYEMCHQLDIPYRVVINEAVELTKKFGAEESHKLVNAVLDKLAREHRRSEFDQEK